MKIAMIKIKNGIRKNIRKNQKEYTFICPLNGISVGDYVVCDVNTNSKDIRELNFKVGRVESLIEDKNEIKKILEQQKPYSYIVCKVGVKDFETRCNQIQELKSARMNKYHLMAQKK
jgi:hypothetical protein